MQDNSNQLFLSTISLSLALAKTKIEDTILRDVVSDKTNTRNTEPNSRGDMKIQQRHLTKYKVENDGTRQIKKSAADYSQKPVTVFPSRIKNRQLVLVME